LKHLLKSIGILSLCPVSLMVSLFGQVTPERLLKADSEPGNWLTYSGDYQSHRFSQLEQINRTNIGKLKLKWVYQMSTLQKVETTPLVVDGVMYATQPPNDVVALDPETGQPFWKYVRSLPEKIDICCGQVNRGLAMLGNLLYMGTVDAHLLALDAKTGGVAWDVEVADHTKGYSITLAPLAVKDKIIVGVSGGEYGGRCFLDAYDAASGKRVWRFYTIPAPGEPGSATWTNDAWKRGGGPTWLTGSYDPELNLLYWGVGNASPDWNGDVRPGDNLYTSSVVALSLDTGTLKWHFQFTPHDIHDWDAVQIPVLVDAEYRGRQRKLMYWANRNAFFYVLDRDSGEFLSATPFAKQTWAERIDEKGRPVRKAGSDPTREGTLIYPGVQGGTNWYSPSFNPHTGLFYLSVWEFPSKYYSGDVSYVPGNRFFGSFPGDIGADAGWSAVRAIQPKTGAIVWEYKLRNITQAGILSTAGNLVFGGTNEGQFFALDSETGAELWRSSLGGMIAAGPVSYLSNGKQQITIAAGSALFTFGIDE
jgi:alcohol dehydrogenase (cytochrome c)